MKTNCRVLKYGHAILFEIYPVYQCTFCFAFAIGLLGGWRVIRRGESGVAKRHTPGQSTYLSTHIALENV